MKKYLKLLLTTLKFPLILVLTLVIAIFLGKYQRTTGPTYPKNVETEVGDFLLQRTAIIKDHKDRKEPLVNLEGVGENITGEVYYRSFPPIKTENGYVPFDTITLDRKDNVLYANFPNQGMAGKLHYFIKLNDGNKDYYIGKDDPIIIRFKGDVPNRILIPHIFCMFTSMAMAILAILSMIFYKGNNKLPRRFSLASFILLTIGGLILGLFVQKYAFNVYWAGFPFAWDLTDNKTLVAVIIWAITLLFNYKKYRPILIIIAVVSMFVVFSIPHSLNGSQRNPETGEMEYQ